MVRLCVAANVVMLSALIGDFHLPGDVISPYGKPNYPATDAPGRTPRCATFQESQQLST